MIGRISRQRRRRRNKNSYTMPQPVRRQMVKIQRSTVILLTIFQEKIWTSLVYWGQNRRVSRYGIRRGRRRKR